MPVVWNTFRNTYNTFKLQGTRRQVSVHFTHSPRMYARGTQIFQKSRNHLRTLNARRVNSKPQKGNMKQVPRWGPKYIRRNGTKFSRPGNLVARICVTLYSRSADNCSVFWEHTRLHKTWCGICQPKDCHVHCPYSPKYVCLLLEMRFISLPACSSSAKQHVNNTSNTQIIQ